MRTRAALAVAGALLVLAGCAQPGGTGGSGSTGSTGAEATAPELPTDGDALVLRVTQDGGFTPAGADIALLPLVSVYRDGRVLSNGPVVAIHPAPAWPDVQVNRVDEATLTELVQAAQDAGVTDTADLGDPSIADARTTTVTLGTAEGTTDRTVYALTEAIGDPALSAEQTAARERLADLVERLTDLTATEALGPWTPTAVAALTGPYSPDPSIAREPVAWPGPALPGEDLGVGVGCTVATGEQAAAVVAAAQGADALTPWTDGTSTWAITFRPLLPDETGCADLTA
ncbi:hypothetical protein SAMN03159343_3401 [Klenkia marina]|uniref:Uncharacterized protein n=1 Tax=Klenkia marina TaxID=1960309 RepID=A0A1G4YSR5_9ACTN|nr:hypothetical protein [Klenkia marina]SCX56385.1 hypothetical protein SAMN03159343_3401 [Klenkia marina]